MLWKQAVDRLHFSETLLTGDPEQDLLVFRVVIFLYASLSLYLDLQPRHYGWQNGAFFAKYTHWVEVLIVLYFGVSIASHFVSDIQEMRAELLAMLLPMTLYLDIGFFVAVYPIRLTGREGGPFLSPTSWHKHLLNLGWIFGDVLLIQQVAFRQARTSTDALGEPAVKLPWMSVNLLPFLLNSAYLVLAWLIRYRPTGLWIFKNILRNPKIDPVFRVAPGLWIYGAFGLLPIQVLHVVGPRYICTPLAHALITWSTTTSQAVVRIFVTVLFAATPFVYCVYSPILQRYNGKKRD